MCGLVVSKGPMALATGPLQYISFKLSPTSLLMHLSHDRTPLWQLVLCIANTDPPLPESWHCKQEIVKEPPCLLESDKTLAIPNTP